MPLLSRRHYFRHITIFLAAIILHSRPFHTSTMPYAAHVILPLFSLVLRRDICSASLLTPYRRLLNIIADCYRYYFIPQYRSRFPPFFRYHCYIFLLLILSFLHIIWFICHYWFLLRRHASPLLSSPLSYIYTSHYFTLLHISYMLMLRHYFSVSLPFAQEEERYCFIDAIYICYFQRHAVLLLFYIICRYVLSFSFCFYYYYIFCCLLFDAHMPHISDCLSLFYMLSLTLRACSYFADIICWCLHWCCFITMSYATLFTILLYVYVVDIFLFLFFFSCCHDAICFIIDVTRYIFLHHLYYFSLSALRTSSPSSRLLFSCL